MAGLWFEEFTDGMVFNHEWSRTITETDNIWFSLLTMNVQPLHIDAHFAAKTEWGKPLVNSLFTLGLLIGMTVNDTTLNTTLANLGMSDVKFPKPLFPGNFGQGAHHRALQARQQVAPQRGHRKSLSRDDEPARRDRRDLRARRADAQETEGGLMRSLLFVPGNSEKMIAKASAGPADVIILDLEDAVRRRCQAGGAQGRRAKRSPRRARVPGAMSASIRSTPPGARRMWRR